VPDEKIHIVFPPSVEQGAADHSEAEGADPPSQKVGKQLSNSVDQRLLVGHHLSAGQCTRGQYEGSQHLSEADMVKYGRA